MIDKKELISTYLQQFGSHYQISRLLNPTLRIDDEFISHFFEQVVDQYGETFAITEEEKTEIERKIKSQYCIFQDEGAALVGDYEHDFMWYANLQAQEDIVDVLETYGVDVVSTIIFTGDRRLGVPQGKDIYDYLKDCFREDLMVIFLFSKAFYDSNICISEAGAAWATNQNCMNVVIDISFSDIEKPSNNALSSIKFQQIRTPDQTITVTEFFKTIIEEGLHFEYDESKLQKALNYVLKTDKYSDQKIDFPATFLPKRKFLPVPRCPKCHNIMLLTEENGRLKYVCSNVSCDECYEAVIN